MHEGALINTFRKNISDKEGVRAYKLQLYDIFSIKNSQLDTITFVANVSLSQERICYKAYADEWMLNDDGDFRLIEINNDFATVLYVKDSKDIEKENKIIEEYLSNRLLMVAW